MGPLGSSGRGESNVSADDQLIQAIGDHVERTIGPIAGVFHEERSTEVHVDVFWVSSAEERPFQTLVSSGAAARAMRPPQGAERFTHLELMMFLPPEWNLTDPSPEEVWPILALRALARYPHKNKTWLWGGHSVPLGYEAAKPFTTGVLTRPYLLAPESGKLSVGRNRRVELFCLMPMFQQEYDFVRSKGDRALIDRAEQADRLAELFIVTLDREPFA